eukprot:11180482-Lingulodinium_polyedra.AAC.1
MAGPAPGAPCRRAAARPALRAPWRPPPGGRKRLLGRPRRAAAPSPRPAWTAGAASRLAQPRPPRG